MSPLRSLSSADPLEDQRQVAQPLNVVAVEPVQAAELIASASSYEVLRRALSPARSFRLATLWMEMREVALPFGVARILGDERVQDVRELLRRPDSAASASPLRSANLADALHG